MRCMTEKINSFDFYVPMDIPLVLEGGAMRGVFEAGVLDVTDARYVWRAGK